MNTEILSREEIEEIAYQTAFLIHRGWRKTYSGWVHPGNKKLKTQERMYVGDCYEYKDVEYNEWSLEEAYLEEEE